MGLNPYAVIVGLAVFAGASFFFALAESALFALGKWQARHLAEKDPVRGGVVAQLLAEPAELLATIVLGNTLANGMIVALGLNQALNERWPDEWTLMGLLLLILVGCEVLPKTLAVRSPARWALRVARPMLHLLRISRPLQKLAHWFNARLLSSVTLRSIRMQPPAVEEEYSELLEMACQQGTLAQAEKEIILEIIALDKKTAQHVMTPRAQMLCISDDLSVEQMIAAAREFRHRRLPIFDETPDTIVGVLDTKLLLLDPAIDLADAIEFPSFVPESMNLLTLLKSLQRQKRGMAIVLDEYGTTAGVVTMEDIIEEMVGEIRSEGESAGFVMEELGPGRWRVNGTMRLTDFQREYPELGPVPGVDTMGGLLVAEKEVVPATGESVVVQGLKLTALAADERRVREVLVEVLRK